MNLSEKELNDFTNVTLYFGHQSVGGNILRGLENLFIENKVSLSVTEVTSLSESSGEGILHSRIGSNGEPHRKIEDFLQILTDAEGNIPEYAMMKFCFADFSNNIDVENLFDTYKKAVSELEALYPELKIIHVTSPLTTREQGMKTYLKSLLGREKWGYEDNIRRHEYNELIRKEFEDELFFDLAKIESTFENGKRNVFKEDDREYFALIPQFTDDGCHLNDYGSDLTAREFVLYINKISKTY